MLTILLKPRRLLRLRSLKMLTYLHERSAFELTASSNPTRLEKNSRNLAGLCTLPHSNERGQAAIETALALPIIIYLIYYMLNTYSMMHTAHIGQKYAAMNIYERLDNRSQFAVDEVERRVVGKTFMAVQYRDPSGQELPKRKVTIENGQGADLDLTVGICREPQCN